MHGIPADLASSAPVCRKLAFSPPRRGSGPASAQPASGNEPLSKFVKFVHFHSAISSSLPQGVSGRGRWLVHLPHSSPRLACREVNPLCLGVGSAPLRKKDYAVRARAANISGSPTHGECAHRMALPDPRPETHHPSWERSAAVLYAWKEQRGTPSS